MPPRGNNLSSNFSHEFVGRFPETDRPLILGTFGINFLDYLANNSPSFPRLNHSSGAFGTNYRLIS